MTCPKRLGICAPARAWSSELSSVEYIVRSRHSRYCVLPCMMTAIAILQLQPCHACACVVVLWMHYMVSVCKMLCDGVQQEGWCGIKVE